MIEIEDLIHTVREEGYDDTNAEAKVGQDIILKAIANSALYRNPEMRENNIEDIRRRMQMVFDNKNYVRGLKNSKRNWLDEDIDTVLLGIQEIFVKLSYSKS